VIEVVGDSARGDEFALVRLTVDGDRIVVADAPGIERPLAGLTLLIGLDRIPDMFRTMTNVTGHLSGAVVMAAIEGERRE